MAAQQLEAGGADQRRNRWEVDIHVQHLGRFGPNDLEICKYRLCLHVAHALRPIVPFRNRPDSGSLIDRFVPAIYTLLVLCFLKPPILDSRSRFSTPPSRKLGNYSLRL
jgi:hypothetical protein